MNKKLVFQLLLILFLIAFIAIFILYFSKKNEKTNISDIKIEKSNPDIAISGLDFSIFISEILVFSFFLLKYKIKIAIKAIKNRISNNWNTSFLFIYY